MKKRTIWRTLLVLVLCCSMVLNVFAAAEESTEVVDNGDGTTTVVTTTETTVTEEGKTVVTVTIQKDTTGTNEEQQTVTGSETYEETTVIERGMVREYDWTIDGSEVKEWTEEDTGDAEGQPEVSVELKPGETTVGTVTETTVTGSTPDGEDDPRYDYTTTTKTDREVTVTTSEIEVKVSESSTKLDALTPDDYEGKYSAENHLFHYYRDGETYDVVGTAPEGADYQFVGNSDHGRFWASQIIVNYLKDENDNTVYDENGEPVIEKLTTKKGTVMLDPETLEPSTDLNQLWKYYNTETGNYEFAKTGTRPTMFVLENEAGEYVTGYCIDLVTGTSANKWYTVANLEDSDYYASEDAENHIRNIVLNGYWGTDIAPDENGEYKQGSVTKIMQDMEAALANGELSDEYTFTYYPGKDGTGDVHTGEEAVTVTVKLSEVLSGLTEGEALAATQAAIWSYANGSKLTLNGEDGMVLANTVYGQLGRGNDYTPENAARVQAVYDWLVNLDEVQESTTVINEKNFVDDLTLTVGDKVQGADSNRDFDQTNDLYNADLNFKLSFTPSSVNDDLLLHIDYVDMDGNPVSITKRLAGDDSVTNFGALTPDENGVYTLEGLVLSENQNFSVDLRVEGTQHLENGVYIYTPVGGRGVSQSMVGVAQGTREVNVGVGVSVSFDVEEENKFRSERKWHVEDPGFILDDDDDPSDPPTDPIDPPTDPVDPPVDPIDPPVDPVDPIEDIPEENVPLEDIPDEEIPLEDLPDEEVPLAAVPQTGDASVYFAILSALSGTGLAGLALTKKKDEK